MRNIYYTYDQISHPAYANFVSQGNEYLQKDFPLMSYISSVSKPCINCGD